MTDLAWMAVCGLSLAGMGAVYLIDRRTWRERAHLLGLQAHAASLGLRSAKRGWKLQVRHYMDEAKGFYEQKQAAEARAEALKTAMIEMHRIAAEAAGVEEQGWNRPVTVGNPEVDAVCAEISLCGPNHAAVYLQIVDASLKTPWFRVAGTRIAVFDRRNMILDAANGVGLIDAVDVEKIVEAVRSHNETFHQAKGDPKDAGVITETDAGDRDRPGCDDHDRGDSRREGADRRQCADRGACPSP